ncbi:hypothetical protein, partial [Streptomyces sp. IBSBF 2394]|uniref:hypothetical protein n=1 Tax=Streptomyces sp. IBSBF 2394 TaxID=2903532 RepID=UPI002FDC141A
MAQTVSQGMRPRWEDGAAVTQLEGVLADFLRQLAVRLPRLGTSAYAGGVGGQPHFAAVAAPSE